MNKPLGNVLPQTPETFGYDTDGNMTNDGRFTYAWDAENRLIGLTSLAGAPAGSKVKLDFAYDYQGRRIQKIVSTNNGSIYVAQSTNKFAYDGWNLIAEVGANGSLIRSYVWGLDLSGSMQGAGGVGGLLKLSYYGFSTTNCFVAYDGNGNVAALINANDSTVSANYEYGPFGELMRGNGMMARANPFRFSTKFQDEDTDLIYYGHRFYSPDTGTWLSRELLGEVASFNLMSYTDNNPISSFDVLGLYNSAGHFYTTYLVARAAGMTDEDAFKFAYWSQYPDLDPNYDALRAPSSDVQEVREYLHSLTGGDANKLRNYLACLLKSGQFNQAEEGILIHALGDAYSHSKSTKNGDQLYGPTWGHFFAGHYPDYIAGNTGKYGEYVDQLYELLSSMNVGGTQNPQIIADLKAEADNLPTPGLWQYISMEDQNNMESDALRALQGGFGESQFSDYHPESQTGPLGKAIQSPEFMQNLMNKIKNGVGGCCPPNK